jgi:amino acid adenylation domain-containing protein
MTIQEAIAARSQECPEHIAILAGDVAVTYAELDRRANRCAVYLRELGVGPDMLVALMLERSVEMIVALLATLKAGGAYVPLDPQYPRERLKMMLEDSGAAVLITQASLVERASDFAGTAICLDEQSPPEAECLADSVSGSSGADDLAYVIYTSGSTGEPKGCMISQAAIVNRLEWMQAEYRLVPSDRVLQKTPYTFDVSVWEFFWPLMYGATLVLARPAGHKDAEYLCDLIVERGVTVCHFVPSMLRLFLEASRIAECVSLRHVFCSGEALPYDLVREFRRSSRARLHNLYGPTEAAVDVTYWECEERADAKVPIGRAIRRIEILLLDANLAEVAAGEAGEICIAGIGLARGYLNRPQLTAERFVERPRGRPGQKIYRTGDLGRLLHDGSIEYLGRQDSQIKLRGVRIEPGEVEAALREDSRVRDVCVVVQEHDTRDPKLVAYVAGASPMPAVAELRRLAARRLPPALVPNAFVLLPELPITVHGKLDRARLPWPPPQTRAQEPVPEVRSDSDEALRAQIAGALLEYFRAALHVDLRPTDNLFDAGATSLTMVQAAARLRDRFGVKLAIDAFLDAPTIASLAAEAVRRRGAAAPPSRAVVQLSSGNFRREFYRQPVCDRFTADVVSRAQLAQLLAGLAADERTGTPKYLYPSAGGLNGVQTYIYVWEGRLAGVPGGAYYHHPLEHALYRVSGAISLESADFATADRDAFDTAAFCLLLVADLDAIAPIYGGGSATLAAIEAGYMSQLLLDVVADTKLALRPATGVASGHVKLDLKLKDSHRLILCLLGGCPEAARAGALTAADSGDIREVFDTDVAAVASLLETATAADLAAFHDRQLQLRTFSPSVESLPLERPPIAPADYRLRSSQREYLGDSCDLAQLGGWLSLLRGAAGEERGPHLFHSDAASRLEVFLYAKPSRIAGLPGGVYRYDPVAHALEARCEDIDAATIEAAYTPFNRRHFRNAAFGVFLVASSQRDRRLELLLQAGRAGQLLLNRQAEFDIGVCPIGGLRFAKLRAALGVDASVELVHSFLGGRVVQAIPAGRQRILEPSSPTRRVSAANDIAIVGVAARLPAARDVREFWTNLERATAVCIPMPEGRRARASRNRSALVGTGAYLEDIDRFDADFFGIAAATARAMDPQERLLLETAWECLEDAGYTPECLGEGRDVGVFVGAMWNDYRDVSVRLWEDGDAVRMTGGQAALANRLCHAFDFRGPSMVVNTSCASALTSMHVACDSLRLKECDAALVGAANLLAHPYHYESLKRLGFLCDGESSRPFSAQAHGWMLGEGVGVLLLKRLEDAQANGDHIYGVIHGSAVGHCGRTARFDVPSADAQARCIRKAIARAGLEPSDIAYVEAAAAGASVADATEMQAIAHVFGGARSTVDPLRVGTLKNAIGHLEAASGISQILKVVWQLERRLIAGVPGSQPLSPLIDLPADIVIPTETQRWSAEDSRESPRALINGIGSSGASAHLIVGAPPPADLQPQRRVGPVLVVLSARSAAALREQALRLLAVLDERRYSDADLADIAYTLQLGRVAFVSRLGCVVTTLDQLSDRLRRYLGGEREIEDLAVGESVCEDAWVRSIGEDADIVGLWLQRGALAQLANAWVRGARIDWARLAAGGKLRRLPLPTYPFARDRYWIDDDLPVALEPREAGAAHLSYPEWQRVAASVSSLRGIVPEDDSRRLVVCIDAGAEGEADLLGAAIRKEIPGSEFAAIRWAPDDDDLLEQTAGALAALLEGTMLGRRPVQLVLPAERELELQPLLGVLIAAAEKRQLRWQALWYSSDLAPREIAARSSRALRDPGESRVRCDRGGASVRRLRVVPVEDSVEPSWQEGGAYVFIGSPGTDIDFLAHDLTRHVRSAEVLRLDSGLEAHDASKIAPAVADFVARTGRLDGIVAAVDSATVRLPAMNALIRALDAATRALAPSYLALLIATGGESEAAIETFCHSFAALRNMRAARLGLQSHSFVLRQSQRRAAADFHAALRSGQPYLTLNDTSVHVSVPLKYAPASTDEQSEDEVTLLLLRAATRVLGSDAPPLDSRSSLLECGFDSVRLLELAALLRREHGLKPTPAMLVECDSIAELARRLSPAPKKAALGGVA